MAKTLVSLCYDGGRTNHAAVVAPQLAELGLRATFFVDVPRILSNLAAWRKVTNQGHEIGNGALLASALPDGTLPAFTVDLILDDIEESQKALQEIFGNPDPCLALPFGEDKCADGPYTEKARRQCKFVRVSEHGINRIPVEDYSRILSLPCDGVRTSAILHTLDETSSNEWIVLAFHNASPKKQDEIIMFLANNPARFTIEPISAAANLIQSPASRAHLS